MRSPHCIRGLNLCMYIHYIYIYMYIYLVYEGLLLINGKTRNLQKTHGIRTYVSLISKPVILN